MYRSLTLLAADDENAARNPDRLAKLARHRMLVPKTKAVSFTAIVLMGLAWLLVMATLNDRPPWFAFVIAGVILLGFFLGARNSWRSVKRDPLRQAAEAPQRFAFAPARITGATVRTEGRGRYQYEVMDATVAFEAGSQKEAIQLVQTFEKSIWNFAPGQFPVQSRVAYQVDDPTRAALITIAQSAINQIDPKKKRDARGYWLGYVFAWGFLVFAAVAFLLGIWMTVSTLMGHKA